MPGHTITTTTQANIYCFELIYYYKAAFNISGYYCLTKFVLGFQLGGTGNLSGLTGPLKQRPLLLVCFDSLLLDFVRSLLREVT